MNKLMVLAMGAVCLLAGCGSQAKKSNSVVSEPKWKGPAYRLALDAQGAKPKAAGIAIPALKFTANPDAVETRVVLVAQFNVPAPAFQDHPEQRMVGAAVDVRGAEGALPAEYIAQVGKQLSDYLTGYCADGKVNLRLALARSSLNPSGATDGDVESKRLSDWLPVELTAKKIAGKCK